MYSVSYQMTLAAGSTSADLKHQSGQLSFKRAPLWFHWFAQRAHFVSDGDFWWGLKESGCWLEELEKADSVRRGLAGTDAPRSSGAGFEESAPATGRSLDGWCWLAAPLAKVEFTKNVADLLLCCLRNRAAGCELCFRSCDKVQYRRWWSCCWAVIVAIAASNNYCFEAYLQPYRASLGSHPRIRCFCWQQEQRLHYSKRISFEILACATFLRSSDNWIVRELGSPFWN